MTKNKGRVISLDIGGTHTRAALFSGKRIVKFIKKETPSERKKILREIDDIIKDFSKEKKVYSIGISIAGAVKNGIVKISPNLPFKNFNIKGYFQRKYRIKTEVMNDADCFAVAELHLGVKKRDFIVLTLGTGIGGGIVINGKVYKGRGFGGELGHIILDNGKDFEYHAGSIAIKRLIKREYGIKDADKKIIEKVLNQNTLKSKKIKRSIARYIGQGIASLISVFDPEAIILAGGMRNLGKEFLDMIKKETKKYSFIPNLPIIRWSSIKHPGIMGARIIATEKV